MNNYSEEGKISSDFDSYRFELALEGLWAEVRLGWHDIPVGRGQQGQRPLSGRIQVDLSREESKWRINRREDGKIDRARDRG